MNNFVFILLIVFIILIGVYENRQLRKDINETWKTIYEYLGKNKENPLDDLNALKNIELVFTKGKMVHPKIKRDKEIEQRLDVFCK